MPPATPAAEEADVDARLRAEVERRLAMAPAMMHSANDQGILRFVSDAWLAKLGYDRSEVLGRILTDFLSERSRDFAMNVVRPQLFRTGRCENVEYQMVRRDGGVIDVLLSAVTHRDPVSGELLTIAVVTDVTALNEARRAQGESEARYRLLADNSSDLIMLVHRDGRREYVSPASFALLGYTPDEMRAIRTAESLHPDEAERVLATLREEPGRTLEPYRMRRKDGSYVWVETSGRAVDAGDHAGLRLVIIRDIEQRVRAEQLVKDSEARYRLLADNSGDMVFHLGTDMRRTYVSPACRDVLGYEPEEMIGANPATKVHPEDAPRVALALQSLISGEAERCTVVNRNQHRDGRWLWVEAQLRALKDPETGHVTGIVGAVRDISARKAIEDALAEANARLQALADQDSLTGLANRRAFDAALAREHQRARRENRDLALIMIDVDRFKAFNDIYGHPAGDDCLRRVALAIADTIARPGDLAVRYGGEEFAVLLPHTDEAGAAVIAERISQAVLGLAIPHSANAAGVVTVSAGVAAQPCAQAKPGMLVDSADRALYRAKDFGRNAVIRASEVAPGVPAIPSAVA